MKALVTRILVTLLALVVLVINGGVWWVWNLDLNDYRSQIATMVVEQTGWRLRFTGDLEHHVTSNGLQLIIKDLLVMDLNGQFVDIEYLQTRIYLTKILDYQISLENMNIAVRNSDIELRPDISPPMSMPLSIDANAVHLTVKDCHIYDVESGVETQVKDLVLDISTVPLVKNGWLMLGMPAGTMWSLQRGTAQVASIAFGNALEMQNLEVDFVNDYGRISISRLTAALKPPPKSQGLGLISPQIKAKGKIHINFDETPEELVRTLWKGVDDIQLEPFTLQSSNLSIKSSAGPIGLQQLQINSEGLPILVHGASLWTWLTSPVRPQLAAPIQRTTISGELAFYDALNLADYTLALELQPGILKLAMQRGALGALLPQQNAIGAVAFNLKGNLNLTLGGLRPAETLPQRVLLEQLTLIATNATLVTQDGDYRLATGNLEVKDLPLVSDGIPITPNLPEALLKAAPARPNAQFSLHNISHKGAVIDSVVMALETRDDVLHLQQLEANIAGTKLTGVGDLRFAESTAPWYLRLTGPNVALNPLLTVLGKPNLIRGALSVDLELKSYGSKLNTMISNLSGNIKIKGYDLQMLSIDIDAILTHLEDSRGVGFLDLGAYILLGPAGILLTKGTQYSVLLGSVIERGQSRIPVMHSELKIKSGVVSTKDVALTTAHHRLAVSGTLDLRENGLASLQIATVDTKGCAKYMETIGGTGWNPQVSQTGMVINSVLNPVKSVVSTLIGGCFIPFYQGQVPTP